MAQKNWGISVFILNLESLLWVAFTDLFKGRLKCETAHQEDSRFYFLFYPLILDRVSLSKGVFPLSTSLFALVISSVLKSSITSETSQSKGTSFKFWKFFPYLPLLVWYCLAELVLSFQQPLIFVQRSWFWGHLNSPPKGNSDYKKSTFLSLFCCKPACTLKKNPKTNHGFCMWPRLCDPACWS